MSKRGFCVQYPRCYSRGYSLKRGEKNQLGLHRFEDEFTNDETENEAPGMICRFDAVRFEHAQHQWHRGDARCRVGIRIYR